MKLTRVSRDSTSVSTEKVGMKYRTLLLLGRDRL